jgi:phage-related tail fiber protein
MADYYAILTTIGRAKLANGQALGIPVVISHFAVGDGNGVAYNPAEGQTALAREVYRAGPNRIYVDPDNPSWLVVEAIIPEQTGGFYVREAGLLDDAGDLIAIAKYPETYKPTLAQGSGKDLYIRMILEFANPATSVTLKIDPAIVLASRKYVDDHAASRNHPAATDAAQGMVELATAAETQVGADASRAVTPSGLKSTLGSYAKLNSPTLTGTPTAPTTPTSTNNTQIATTAFVLSLLNSFGLGTQNAPAVTNLDEVKTTGIYTNTGGAIGTPESFGVTFVLGRNGTVSGSSFATFQIFCGSSGTVWTRSLSNTTATWTAWATLATTDSALSFRGNLGSGDNLDNIIAQGIYHNPSSSNAHGGNKYPLNNAGWLIVHSTGAGATTSVHQTYEAINQNRVFFRSLLVGAWSAWKEIASTTAATTDAPGLVELATVDETRTGTDGGRAITPAAFRAARRYRDIAVYGSSGSFTVPAGVTHVHVRLVAGGGGGGGSISGGGGGAGGYAEGMYSVTAGQTITVTVGAGGTAGPSGGHGGNGGTSSFGSYISATGGMGGRGGNEHGGGGGGAGINGALNTVGGYGGDGIASGVGGQGGASFLGGGGKAGTASGANGSALGSGGGGGYGGSYPGGAGASGVVIVEW